MKYHGPIWLHIKNKERNEHIYAVIMTKKTNDELQKFVNESFQGWERPEFVLTCLENKEEMIVLLGTTDIEYIRNFFLDNRYHITINDKKEKVCLSSL